MDELRAASAERPRPRGAARGRGCVACGGARRPAPRTGRWCGPPLGRVMGTPAGAARERGPGHQCHAHRHDRRRVAGPRGARCARPGRASTWSIDRARHAWCARRVPWARPRAPVAACSWARRWRSLELWLGVPAPIDAMRAALRDERRGWRRCLTPSRSSACRAAARAASAGWSRSRSVARSWISTSASARPQAVRPARIIGRDGEARFREIEAPRSQAVRSPSRRRHRDRRWRHHRPAQPLGAVGRRHVGLAGRPRCAAGRATAPLRRARPLVVGDAVAALARLRAAREPFYAAADVRVESKGSTRAVAAEVVAARPDAASARTSAVRRPGETRPPDGSAHVAHGLRPRPRRCDAGPADRTACRRGCPWSWPTKRVAAALPGLMAAFPGERQLCRHGRRARQAACSSVERLLEDGGGPARGARRRVDRRRRRHHRATSWAPPQPCISGACPWCRCRPPGLPSPTPRSAARSPSTSPRPRTRRVPSGRPWRSSGTSPPCGPSPATCCSTAWPRCIKSAVIGDPWLWALLEARGEAALGGPDGTPDEAARYAMVERAMHAQAGRRRPRSVRGRRATDAQPGSHPGPRPRDREPLPAAARPGRRARPACRGRHRGGPRRRARPRRAHRRPPPAPRLPAHPVVRPGGGPRRAAARTRSASGAASAGSCPWPSAASSTSTTSPSRSSTWRSIAITPFERGGR